MSLTQTDLEGLTALRHSLHRWPEVSGQESETARRVVAALPDPDALITELGGEGVAAVYDSGQPGPTVMIRSELDALPIQELGQIPHASARPGVAHLCGHDGHSVILLGLARLLARQRPGRGRVVLLFQPAEEDGSGAAAVLADPRFAALAPDWAFALHNWPGIARGHAWLAAGPANCASLGLTITLQGGTAHASMPETGRAPTPALSRLIDGLRAMGPGGAVQPGYKLATITHLRMGEAAFGIAPGEAELWVTLRAVSDSDLDALLAEAQALARQEAAAVSLDVDFAIHDPFRACANHPEAVEHLARALKAEGIAFDAGQLPIRASEDFGRFGAGAKSAMLFLGAGLDHPALHTERYDFPDALIAPGVGIFHQTIRALLG